MVVYCSIQEKMVKGWLEGGSIFHFAQLLVGRQVSFDG